MKVTYEYVEPKTPEERATQELRVSRAYAVIFEATLNSDRWKKRITDRKRESGRIASPLYGETKNHVPNLLRLKYTSRSCQSAFEDQLS